MNGFLFAIIGDRMPDESASCSSCFACGVGDFHKSDLFKRFNSCNVYYLD